MKEPMQSSMTLRSYQESFEPEKIKIISGMISDLAELGQRPTDYRLYTSEIQNCLSVGLLLASISVSTALLELFIRDLAVAVKIISDFDGNMRFKGEVERSFEEDRTMTFASMLEAIRLTVLAPDDYDALRDFYEKTRIPFAHGLVRRLTNGPELPSELDNLFSQHARGIGLEERLEDGALSEIEFVLRILKRYHPWLLRRYS